jgi:uncharacterized membrane protein
LGFLLRIKLGSGVLALDLLVVVLALVIYFFPSTVLRIILGIPFVLFFPGYVLTIALYPRKSGLGDIARVVLSLTLSIAVVTLIGLILNYIAWGIRMESMLYSNVAFIFIITIIAWLRRKRLPEDELFNIGFTLMLPSWGKSRWDKALTVVLVLVILAALGAIGYAIAKPKVGQKFTEFYILGLEDKAADYPETLNVGQEGIVTIGIVNNEYQEVNYRVEVLLNAEKADEVGPVRLEQNEKYEETVTFTLYQAGDNQKIEFLLYKNGDTEPYLEPLRLWIDVK